MNPGEIGWSALAAAALALIGASWLRPSWRQATLPRLLAHLLGSWAGRLVLLALWAWAGLHLLSQRP